MILATQTLYAAKQQLLLANAMGAIDEKVCSRFEESINVVRYCSSTYRYGDKQRIMRIG